VTPGMIQRHQDYVLGPNQDGRLATVAAGAAISGITLSLDTDAPFLLRSRALRCRYDAGRLQTGLNQVRMRFTGPDRDYRSQDYVRQSLYGPYFGQFGNPIPVSSQIIYPRQGQITVDLINDGAAGLTNLTFYFRGVKLFAPNAVKSYSYPPRFGVLPFSYPQLQVTGVPVTTGPIRYPFRVRSDADFVLRSIQAGDPFDTHQAYETFIRLYDEDEKPYSNDFVHLDVIAGNSGVGNTFPTATTNKAPIGTGPASPGLFYPELYLPNNHVMFFDITRDDSFVVGATTVNLPITFSGMKVFEK